MADNITVTSGSYSATIAADDIGGVLYQRVKGSLGVDGAAADPIAVSAALDSDGSGVQAVGMLAQFDDSSTATVTENKFAAPRISSRRALLVEGVASGTAITVTGTVNTGPVSTGGASVYRLISAATNNANNIKASAGQIYGWYFSNENNAFRYLKFYNKATSPTVGTDTPFLTLPIPGKSAGHVAWPFGIAMGTGISVAIVSGQADNNNGSISAGDVVIDVLYS